MLTGIALCAGPAVKPQVDLLPVLSVESLLALSLLLLWDFEGKAHLNVPLHTLAQVIFATARLILLICTQSMAI